MTTPRPITSDHRDPTADAPVGLLVALGAAFGLLAGLLLAVEIPLATAGGAVVGLLIGLAIDTWRIES